MIEEKIQNSKFNKPEQIKCKQTYNVNEVKENNSQNPTTIAPSIKNTHVRNMKIYR